jgi:hypothetical protein
MRARDGCACVPSPHVTAQFEQLETCTDAPIGQEIAIALPAAQSVYPGGEQLDTCVQPAEQEDPLLHPQASPTAELVEWK